MKEIRLHGRGGMGTVKAAEILVYSHVKKGNFGNSIPFFGFERQGAPVTAFVKLDDKPIRPKTQVYNPQAVIVLDPTICNAVDVYAGLTEPGIVVMNYSYEPGKLPVPPNVSKVAVVDATALALDVLGVDITNTAMLGAFIKATGWVDLESVKSRIDQYWGQKNADLSQRAFDATKVIDIPGGDL